MFFRIIIYYKSPEGKILFALNKHKTFMYNILNFDEFILQNKLIYHDDFSVEVSSEKSACCLLQCCNIYEFNLNCSFYSFPEIYKIFAQEKKLNLKEEKRFLVLAVQYISQGGVIDSVMALEYNKQVLNEMKHQITSNLGECV